MDKFYDWVIVTPIPAFYKVNLYNKLAQKFKLLVVSIASTSSQRQADFYGHPHGYDAIYLWEGDLETRAIVKTLSRLRRVLKGVRCQRLLVGGWDLAEFWLSLFLLPHAHKVLALESSCYESQTTGLRAQLKRLFFKRIDTVLASGKAQVQLAQLLGFQGNIVESQGVGLFHQSRRFLNRNQVLQPRRFLFVGRLAPEKNVALLLAVFRHFPMLTLTIVGTGPLAQQLEAIASDNVRFVGHVPNHELGDYYQAHDVFILPSQSEPWGLVIEEALYYGLPVIVSDRVGCSEDLVKKPGTGLIFKSGDMESLQNQIETIQEPACYERLHTAVQQFDFEQINNIQLQCYQRISLNETPLSA